MKTKLSIILFAVATIFYGCTDNPVDSTPIGNGYFPLTLGSSWVSESQFNDDYHGEYLVTFKDSIVDEQFYDGLRYALLDTKVIDSPTPNEFITNAGIYRRSNDTIYRGNSYNYAGPSQNIPPGSEKIFLVERKGATWSFTSKAAPSSYTQKFTVIDKGIQHTVDSTIYEDVLHIHVVNTVFNYQGIISTSEWDEFYAKDIGLVQAGEMRLKSYSIK